MDKGYNFFRWLVDEVIDGRDLKIKRQRKKILKLKHEVVHIRGLF